MKAKYAVLICLCLGAAGYAIHHCSYKAGELSKDKDWQIRWERRDKADTAANLAAEKNQRNEEHRRQTETEEIVKNAERDKQNAINEAIAADAAADSLRGALRDIRRKLANSETGKLSADAASRQTAIETANMLANLYEESDRRAGELAEYADAAASAGAVCERTYDAVTRSVE
ncbi:TPA: DUF2514 family protein [Kluyvera cryocrescens]|nr:DUF2514 family protein [Kluyvera cryocrescens]